MKRETILYEHNNLNYDMSFETKNGQLMINATELAKPFGKRIYDFTRLENTKNFIDKLNSNNKISEVLYTTRGGKYQGTWMCEELALKFAAWLSPSFDLWVQIHIKKLLKTGKTSISNINTDAISPIQAHINVDEQKNNSKLINHKMYTCDMNRPKSVSNIINYNVKS